MRNGGGSIKLLDESNVSELKTSQGNMTWDGHFEKVKGNKDSIAAEWLLFR